MVGERYAEGTGWSKEESDDAEALWEETVVCRKPSARGSDGLLLDV